MSQFRDLAGALLDGMVSVPGAKLLGRSLLFRITRSSAIGRKNRLRVYNLLADRIAASGEVSAAVPVPENCELRINFRLELTDELSRLLYFFGYDHYEVPVRKILTKILDELPSDDSCHLLEVGGNIGYYTLLLGALAMFGRKGHVHAFEPSPLVFQLLRRNLSLNGRLPITLNEAAVSDVDGGCTLFLAHQDYGHSGASLVPGAIAQVGAVTVKSITLDGYVAKLGDGRVGLLKMDCEGAEARVLAGAERILRRDSPNIVLEILPRYPSMPAELAALPIWDRYRKFLITDSGLVECGEVCSSYEHRDWLFTVNPPAGLIRA